MADQLADEQITDSDQWIRHFWRAEDMGQGERPFVALASLLRFQRLVSNKVEEQLKPLKLNLTDYMILMVLSMAPSGARPMRRLAKGLLMHPTTTTLATDRLQARGLLNRQPHETDRRATMVAVTDAGRELAASATKALQDLDFGFTGISETELNVLIHLLAGLRTTVGDEGA